MVVFEWDCLCNQNLSVLNVLLAGAATNNHWLVLKNIEKTSNEFLSLFALYAIDIRNAIVGNQESEGHEILIGSIKTSSLVKHFGLFTTFSYATTINSKLFSCVPKILLEVFRIVNIITPDQKTILQVKLLVFELVLVC
jgi:hypothetical protein